MQRPQTTGPTQETAPTSAAIRIAATPHDIGLARELILEYAKWLGVDLCFQGIDEELKSLPGAYAAPLGRLLIAGTPGSAFACIALRSLGTHSNSSDDQRRTGEVKRLYVRPSHRNQGWARHLTKALLEEARAIGYRELKLDTLDWMTAARSLYADMGFEECAPYYANPLPGVIYMKLQLAGHVPREG